MFTIKIHSYPRIIPVFRFLYAKYLKIYSELLNFPRFFSFFRFTFKEISVNIIGGVIIILIIDIFYRRKYYG